MVHDVLRRHSARRRHRVPLRLANQRGSRSSAHVSQDAPLRPARRAHLVVQTAGNLALSQAVLSVLRTGFQPDAPGMTLWNAKTMFDAATVVGEAVRSVHARDSEAMHRFGLDFNLNLIVGGQIRGERPRLFNVYNVGNFIESTAETPYFQLGEAKYGKPILDRVITASLSLHEAAKCALVSMDSTMKSNLSVGLPLDLVCYKSRQLRNRSAQAHRRSGRVFQLDPPLVGPTASQGVRRAAEPAVVGELGASRGCRRDRELPGQIQDLTRAAAEQLAERSFGVAPARAPALGDRP